MLVREYAGFIREYLELAELKRKYLVMDTIAVAAYKAFWLMMPLVASLIVQNLVDQNAEGAYLSLLALALLYLFYNIALYANYKIYGFNMSYCYDRMTKKVLDKLLSVDNNFARKIGKGRAINSTNGDIISVGDMCDEIAELFMGLLQVAGALIIVGCYNLILAGILAAFCIAYFALHARANRQVFYYHAQDLAQHDRYSNLLTQVVAGLQEIKTFNMLPKLKTRLNSIQRRFTEIYTRKRHWHTMRDIDTKIIVYGFRFILYIALLFLLEDGRIDIGVLVMAVGYHESLVSYIADLFDAANNIRENNIAVRRINEILDYTSEEIEFGLNETDEIKGVLELKNVSLKLKDKEVLHNINLKIPHDEVVAIVGEAGSGKTMIFNLLLRLYQPTRGKILLDNINIYDFSKEVYARNVSVANQKPFVFNMSIRKNLNFVDRNIQHQIEACKKAGIHDFIETLPNSYNTVLRENGNNISGGQKQMISIARTILSDAEVLLLDDITTSLDPDTAKLVPKLINNLRPDHTIVMITKKPELMREADRIVVLDKGRINDVGTHAQLLKRNEIYQLLQSRKSPSKAGVFDSDSTRVMKETAEEAENV